MPFWVESYDDKYLSELPGIKCTGSSTICKIILGIVVPYSLRATGPRDAWNCTSQYLVYDTRKVSLVGNSLIQPYIANLQRRYS